MLCSVQQTAAIAPLKDITIQTLDNKSQDKIFLGK